MIIVDLNLPPIFQKFKEEVNLLIKKHGMDSAIGMDSDLIVGYLTDSLVACGNLVATSQMKLQASLIRGKS